MINAHTKSADDTQAFASALAEGIENGDLVLLVGEIGAGKTTFTQGFGRGLGVSESITSPTFVLMHTYQGNLPLHHVDIYRLEHLQEVIDLGLMEILDEGGVALVEWGDLASPIFPRDLLEVQISVDDDELDSRNITLNGVGSQWSVREGALAHLVSQWIVELPPIRRAETEDGLGHK
jgi:tRNA threonylcarbamoyladenosine biosynthesis protein TsaE